MSQHAVERTLGKLATDDEFRARFFENPGAATWDAGLLLSPMELEALSGPGSDRSVQSEPRRPHPPAVSRRDTVARGAEKARSEQLGGRSDAGAEDAT